MSVAVLNVEYLSAYLSVPQRNLNSVIESPTTELVRSILDAIATKAREHDELAADKLRVDIELESVVRNSESRVEVLRSSLERSQKLVEELRTKSIEEESARTSLDNELQNLKSTSTTSTSEVETLRARITSLESANRDTVAVLESKTTANDALATDLQKQHQRSLDLSQQITTLQQSVQSANTAVSSAKFREQSLNQEVDLAKRNNEWFENELKTKSAEALKYRKEKGARIAELQRLNDEASSSLEALKRTELALRSRLDEVQKKAEDSLTKIQQLQEDAAKAEEGFRQELDSARRLAELQAQQTETHRNRLKEVEAGLDTIKDDAAREVGHCRQEAETERQEREQAEHRIAELEAELDRLEAQVTQHRAGSVPGTPRYGLNGSSLGRPGSPAQFGTPGSVRSKSTITATQAIDELYKVKGQLATEKRRGDRLAAELEELMQGLEAKGPEMEEMQAEHERLQREIVEMSKFVDQSGKDKDKAKKDARKAESELSTTKAESHILRQQLRDLSAQIKMLLCDMEARDRGLDALNAAERLELEQIARGEVAEGALEGMTDTDKFISQRLVVFRSVSELQEKNEELLRITRTLGAQMESEEALAAKHQAAKDHEQVLTLQSKIENYKDELQNLITRSESYIKERDMFRRMLQHRGQIPPTSDLASVFGQSIQADQNGAVQTIENQGSRDHSNTTLLRELQAQYDQYREEQTIDRRTLKHQVDRLSQEKSSLQADIAKLNSQVALTSERYDLLQSNYTMLQAENKELQRRSQTLSEASARQDIRTQQVAEDLVEAKGLVESMRNENANLKAEKKLWKDIQDRLSQDNESLMNERGRLNTLVSNQQTLQNERELSDSENRRRLQTQVEALEAEMSITKRKLNDEIEDNKKAQLRKEYDGQQNQRRIDDLATSLNHAREELVAAKTTRDHLQSRVDELTIELRSAEERVEVLQPRPTPRPNAANSTIDSDLTRQQELSLEISELRRDLELARSELDGAKLQMEQYKSISQSSEEELQSLNNTQDQYREEMDRVVEEKDQKIRDLEQRADDIASELINTNNELTTLRNQQSEVARQAEEQKAALDAEIARLKDEDERHATAAQFHQQDLRAQAAIATKAQQDYENELVKHAEAAKLLQALRVEHNQLKTDVATLRADAESARAALSQSEVSWEERREQFEKELKELGERRNDLNAQNKILHQQLDSVGAQISALQQSRSSISTDGDAHASELDSSSNRTTDGLLELNAFLRREKEIVEVQYDLKVQEAKRLQQQFDYTRSQLDECRLKLDQERRLQADSSRSSGAHKDLMDKLNELNLIRESSVTLRNEARQAQTQLAEKTKRVQELTEQIQPLETKIRELEHGKDTMDGEMRLLQEDRDRWQKRTQDIISKYDRIDPADMEQLKETIESLRSERDALLEENKPLQEKLDSFEAEKAGWQIARQKLIDQAKERNRQNTNSIKDRTLERDSAIQEKESLQQQLSDIRKLLENAMQEKDAAETQVASVNQEFNSMRSERDKALAAVSQSTSAVQASASVAQADPTLEHRLTEQNQQLEIVMQEKQSLETEIKDLKEQLVKVNAEKADAVVEIAELKAKQIAQPAVMAVENGHEEGQVDENQHSVVTEAERAALEERIAMAEAKAQQQEEKANKLEEQIETTIKTRSEKMKTALNKKLAESRESQKAQFEADFKLKLEQEKQIWLAESKTSQAAPPVSAQQMKSSDEAAITTPATPAQNTPSAAFSLSNLSDNQIREIIQSNSLAREIMKGNILQKVGVETQKIKDEHAKALEKAESAKTQAVVMETKKSALRINMLDNKSRLANGKLEIVEKAALETPQRPVNEVWTEAKAFKLPPPAAPPAPTTASATTIASTNPGITGTPGTSINTVAATGVGSMPNGTSPPIPKLSEVKTEAPPPQTPSQASTTSSAANGPSVVQPSGIPNAPQPNSNPVRASSIPTMRAGASVRGRGNAPYQVPRGAGQAGRGRGGSQGRGGLNASAAAYSPTGSTGQKRPREESSLPAPPGNGGKRPRGG